MNNKWGTMKWYLYDSSQHTLKEISGLWMDNEKPKLLWNWFGYEYFYRWYHWWDSFWTGKYWKPFFIDSKNQITTFEAQFELPWKDNNKKFDPIYQRLHNFYSTRCGWRATQCSKFKVTKSYLSSYLSSPKTQPTEKICLILEKDSGFENAWKTKTPCPESLSK
ncbi:hypothetical protein DNK47_00655 [Mycoplasma wenyonii]|uniref:Uncharacterized protein n=1 Tax=Mycoplasma wenyonii TaxID=65123 RepID=A0A328PNQ2_9MOLU|nr:hypothetical protein [Mycoplasma wenyonii]RAO95345.1 hypothetical protein DNK47_00655 [Mycoplasma wenyonii]